MSQLPPRHPECGPNEYLLGNMTKSDAAKSYPQWKTKRLGQTALCTDGQPVYGEKDPTHPNQRLYPLFVDMNEVIQSSDCKNFNQSHPELRQGEIFLMNVFPHEFNTMPLTTKRLGETCYFVDGQPNDKTSMRPLFVQISEVDERCHRRPT